MRYLSPLLLLSVLFLGFVGAFAQDGLRPAAGLTWPLENEGTSAKTAALASSTVAAPGDLHSLDLNPAGLADLDRPQAGLHHHSWVRSIVRETASFALPLGSPGVLGLSFSLLDHGALETRDEDGGVTGSVHPRRLRATLAWGRKVVKGLSLGGSLSGKSQSMAQDSEASFSADVGGLWAITPRFRFGAGYANWGPYIRDALQASVVRLGASWTPAWLRTHRALLAASLSLEPYGVQRLHLGAEDLVGGKVSLRAGYQWDLGVDPLEDFHGLAAGAGLVLDPVELDYSFQPFGELGNSHRISLTYAFGTAPHTAASVPSTDAKPATGPTGQGAPVTAAPGATQDKSSAARDDLKLYFQLPGEAPAPETKKGTLQDAIADREKKVGTDPSDAVAWMDLGRLYLQTGRKESAVQCFEQVLRLRPDAVQLKAWLERFKALPPGVTP